MPPGRGRLSRSMRRDGVERGGARARRSHRMRQVRRAARTRAAGIVAMAAACVAIFAPAAVRAQAQFSPQSPAQSATPATAQTVATPSTPRPSFEAASIKVDKSGSETMMIPIDLPGGHTSARNANLRFLISVAYKLPSFPGQTRVTLLGGPSWMDSEHFDIEAEVEGNPSVEEKRLMLQSLLADRFGLRIHHETRQLPAFALVQDKGAKLGPQLQPHNLDAKCLGPSDTYSAPPVPGSTAPIQVPCDNITFRQGPFASWTLAGVNVDLDYLALVLSYWQGIDRAMVNRTGLTGKYDLQLQYTPQIPGADTTDASAPPIIFTAVQQQLGLKLEATRAPVDVIVIDHVEEPSPN